MASNVGIAAQHVLVAQSTANAVGGFDGGVAHNYHTLTAVGNTGVSAGVVALELSNDNVNWFAPSTNTVTFTTPATLSVTVGPSPYQFARARISTVMTGGTVDAFIAAA
jgi:hypothetical protein